MNFSAPEPSGVSGNASLSAPLVLVTGAAGGIGQAVVARLVSDGLRVVATDLDETGLEELAQLHGPGTASDGLVHVRPLDVRDRVAVDALVDEIETTLGPIDGLVNGHGILRAGSALVQEDDDWLATLDTNAGGVMRVSRAVTRRMALRQRGAVVTITSNAAAVARDGLSAYAASKAAAQQYTRCLGLELAPLGVRCNLVSPGSTDTPMLSSAWSHGDRDERPGERRPGELRAVAGTPEAFWPGIPLGQIARPAQVAEAVAFLLSDRAAHVTLQDLRVDGGATLGA